jgi:putative addiction module CopG family antidote
VTVVPKNLSISLGDPFEGVIQRQISNGRYGSASEVIQASLRLIEEHEQKVAAPRSKAKIVVLPANRTCMPLNGKRGKRWNRIGEPGDPHVRASGK